MARVDKPETLLDVEQGEFIEYSVRYRGAVPTFAIVDDEDQRILGPDDPRDADGTFRAQWPAENASALFPAEHVLAVAFVAAPDYHYRAVRKRANGSTAEVLKDLRFTGNAGSPPDFNSLSVLLPEQR